MVRLDHIEVHVSDVSRYCALLREVFEGGRWDVISPSGTSMFVADDGTRIEVKRRPDEAAPIDSGFCRPCVLHPHPDRFVSRLGFAVTAERTTDGVTVLFFKDHEGITWHVKPSSA